jgi:hypothetical protein
MDGRVQGARSRKETLDIGGKNWVTFSANAQGGTRAISVLTQSSRQVIGETYRFGFSLFDSDHRAAHLDFLSSLELEAE